MIVLYSRTSEVCQIDGNTGMDSQLYIREQAKGRVHISESRSR